MPLYMKYYTNPHINKSKNYANPRKIIKPDLQQQCSIAKVNELMR